MSRADRVVEACRERGLTIGTAESLTARMVAATLAQVPGCSVVLRGGVVAYATEVKGSVLGLARTDLEHVVSEDTVRAMAQAACRVLQADLGLATTGVAGPDVLDGQPPGTVWIAVHDQRSGRTVTRRLALPGERQDVRQGSVDAVLDLALDLLDN